MLRNKLVRSDGSVIDSSVIISCEYTEEVNCNTNLTVGDVSASELAVEILSTTPVQQGEILTYYIIEDGVETKIGIFNTEKPTVATKTTMRFSAYDNVIKTEKLFSDWLRDNQGLFPMTLLRLVQYACSYCGVTLATTDFPHSSLSVGAFYGDNITCRQILAWASAIAGRFVRAKADGKLEFAWYVDAPTTWIVPSRARVKSYVEVKDDGDGNVSLRSKGLTVEDDGAGNVTLLADGVSVTTTDSGITLTTTDVVIPFLQGTLAYENYNTAQIKRVQINHAQDDVGVIYPTNATGNCFTISENMILGVADRNAVTSVAADLYSQLKSLTYVPFHVTTPRTIHVRAGDIVTVMDGYGNSFAGLVMKVSVSPSGTSIESTGDKSYESGAAVASEKYANLTGKMLRVEKSVEGLKVVASDLAGNISTLEQTTSGLATRVENAEGDISSLEQTATGLSTRIENVAGDVSTLEQTASGLATRVTDVEGRATTLEQTATGLKTKVETAEGDISTLEQTAAGLATRVGTAEGDISTLKQTATSLSTQIGNVAGDVSTLEQTATDLTSRIESAEGGISTIHQSVNGIEARVGTTEGNYSQLRQDVDGFESRIVTAEGDINTLQSDAEGFRSTIESVEGRTSTLEQTSVAFTTRFGVVEEDIRKTKAYITTGLLETTSDGTEVYGVEIGQGSEADGDGTVGKYARFTHKKLSFYDGNANEVTQIGDQKMAVTNIEIIASPDTEKKQYGTFKQGGFVDITLADGSVVTKWVGGE